VGVSWAWARLPIPITNVNAALAAILLFMTIPLLLNEWF